MRGKILPIVAAGVEVEFVRDSARRQQIVKLLRTRVEAVFIGSAAIEIDLEPGGAAVSRQREGSIALPEGAVRGRAECGPHHAHHRRLPGIGNRNGGKFFQERGAVHTDGAE